MPVPTTITIKKKKGIKGEEDIVEDGEDVDKTTDEKEKEFNPKYHKRNLKPLRTVKLKDQTII